MITENAANLPAFLTVLSVERLKELLDYNPITGIFTWKKSNKVAGTINTNGYVIIRISSYPIRAHSLAWLFIYDEWPKQIDHKDRDTSNNAILNLRKATHAQNLTNRSAFNELGVKGVYRSRRKFRAQIMVDGNNIYLGTFNMIEEASNAYENAAKEAYGEFASAR